MSKPLDPADVGAESVGRVLGIDPTLEGVAGERDVALGDRECLVLRGPDHQLDDVDAGDLFGDRMFDLEAGVHLEEEELAGLVVDDELDGARRVVPHGGRERHGGAVQAGAGRVGQIRGGCLLEHLLVATLHRTLAGAEVDHVAVPVADDLDLDVAWPL